MSNESNWKKFEIDATRFLNDRFGEYASFLHQGGEDSTISDILVNTKNSNFYIEAKSAQAQSGQFVLLPDFEKEKFYFSTKNKSEENELTSVITNYMNSHWDEYKDVSTNGLNLNLSNKIFSKWIIDYYRNKQVKYFISGTSTKFIIVPIDKFSTSFDVSAVYRRKKSGTRPLPKSAKDIVESYLTKKYPNSTLEVIGKHTYLRTLASNLDKCSFSIPNSDKAYYLSKDNNVTDGYRVSIKSTTNNPNVIFSIKLINGTTGISEAKFISLLQM